VSEDYLLFARTRPVLVVTNRTGCSGAAVRMRELTAHDEHGFNSSIILTGLQIHQAH
jgi:hypothetical protein